MISRTVSSQGFELNYLVPETTEEYNSLAPKRNNPVLEDAILSTWYRNGANKFRDALCEHLEKVTGVARLNLGTDDDPKWEQEGKFIKRVIVALATQAGIDPASNEAKTSFYTRFQADAQAILNMNKFDPSERESTGGGGGLVAKLYIGWATTAVKNGNASKLAAMLSKVLNQPIPVTGDEVEDIKTLSKGIAANEKRKRDLAKTQEYSVEG